MAELDHLVFTCPDLEVGTAHIAEITGARAVAGGPHPGVGTHNALLSLGERTYLEIIAIDPAQPEVDGPLPFGLRPGSPPRLAAFAVHPSPGESLDDVAGRMRFLGFDPGEAFPLSRVQPDGGEISWRLTLNAGDPTAAATPGVAPVPFIIDWGSTPSPATTSPTMGDLIRLEIRHPDPSVRALIDGLDLDAGVSGGPSRLLAVVGTDRGRVEIV